MPGQLSARSLASLTKPGAHQPGRHTDGEGLHLHVRPAGQAAWVLRFRLHGRQRDLGLGGYPEVGLAEARDLAREARVLVSKGVDPTLERQRGRQAAREAADPARSFRAAAEALMASKGPAWRNAKHARQWARTLELYAFPTFGTWPVGEVDTASVLAALQPVWTRVPETARRLRERIEAVLDFARARGWRAGENPARWRGHLAELLPSPRQLVRPRHHPSLPWTEMPAFWTALMRRDGTSAQALRLLILTAARSGEVREMRWAEVDVARAVWTVPAERMKARRTHRVPLSPEALEVLQGQAALPRDAAGRVFSGARPGRPLSDMALSALVRGMATDGLAEEELPRWRDTEGAVVVPHGFRSSFREWTRARGVQDHLGEIALAHVDKDRVRAAYARSDLLEERRAMMERWARWCTAVRDDAEQPSEIGTFQ